jgi:hypothetical protein
LWQALPNIRRPWLCQAARRDLDDIDLDDIDLDNIDLDNIDLDDIDLDIDLDDIDLDDIDDREWWLFMNRLRPTSMRFFLVCNFVFV